MADEIDRESLELARFYLRDSDWLTADDLNALADAIQRTVDAWLAARLQLHTASHASRSH
jgi:S-adenosylmethionine:diacylglycerol 3-amino-3-carboxypropyl transferase